ncbi:MAG: 5-formyltetrahydrofolate cyclo-ligase [Deltaproteobacteria bacterium]|nr:5-formyltetrahydrofolate cyclo-ligase [Deltaproteobacteria bacterium]
MTADAKTALRRRVLAARNGLSAADREERSRAVAERVAALRAFEEARSVALYAPLGAEVDTAEIERRARAAGKQVAWPRIGAGRVLGFACCARDELRPGPRGALEPPPGSPPLEAGDLDLVCVPGVAFDSALRRLGRGGGHYDATLPAAWRARKVGLAFEVQIVGAVPAEPHDAPVDLVVTEARVLQRAG